MRFFWLEVGGATAGRPFGPDGKDRSVLPGPAIVATASFEKRRCAKREAERRENERLQQLRYEEQRRIERLKRNAAAWDEAQQIRAYLAAVEEKAAAREGGIAADKAMSKFLEWGYRYADSLDATGAPASEEWAQDESEVV